MAACEAEPRLSVHPGLVSEADRAPGLCAGGMSLPPSQFCRAAPACHQGMDRDGRQERGARRVKPYLDCS